MIRITAGRPARDGAVTSAVASVPDRHSQTAFSGAPLSPRRARVTPDVSHMGGSQNSHKDPLYLLAPEGAY